MSIQLHISPQIIPSVASLYNDTNRIFMEYIDNAIDSAEEFFNPEVNEYSKGIEITLKIVGNSYRDGKIIISDNCFGITNFKKVVQCIGNSDKKAQPWTNGQFGYGIYSFMAACRKIEITSKIQGQYGYYIPIERDQFKAEKQEDVNFPDPARTGFDHKSGTEIILSGFDKEMWKGISFEEIKMEIEKHFELLLKRRNLQIKLIDHNGSEYICKEFDYNQYEGEEYDSLVTELYYIQGRKCPQKITLTLAEPIHIYLKITKGKNINKPPIFTIKGRRIAEIKDVKSFKSKHKSDIWGHPNLTGFIDVSGCLTPTIARNDFGNNDKTKAVMIHLEEMESIILELIQDINKESEEQHYHHLENELNKVLSKLARIDALNYRTEYLKGSEINLEGGGAMQKIDEGFGSGSKNEGKGNGGDGGGEEKGEGTGPTGETGDDMPLEDEETGDGPSNQENENPFEDSDFKGAEKRKSGFNIKIVDWDLDINEENNKPERSRCLDGYIFIFRKHPDFIDRVIYSHKGEAQVSQRLITYLAGEITVHYKDILHKKNTGGQPEYNINLFKDLVEFIYKFEELLKPLKRQNLSDFK